MKVNYVKLTAGVLTGFMALSSVPYAVYAAGPTAGVASYTSDIVGSSNTLTAGVTSMLTDIMLKEIRHQRLQQMLRQQRLSLLSQHMLIQQLHRLMTVSISVQTQMRTVMYLESSITMELVQSLRQQTMAGTRFSQDLLQDM